MYSFVDLPVVVFDEAFATVATEEAVLSVVLSLMSVPMTFYVESFTTNGAHKSLIFSLANTVSGGEVSYQVGRIVVYGVNNLLADLTDTDGTPRVLQVLHKVLPYRASLLPSLFGLHGLLQSFFSLCLLICMRGG